MTPHADEIGRHMAEAMMKLMDRKEEPPQKRFASEREMAAQEQAYRDYRVKDWG